MGASSRERGHALAAGSVANRSSPTDRFPVMAGGPRPITHVGLSVPDIHAAVEWYRDVLGFRVLVAPSEIGREDPMAVDVFGPRFQRMLMAHLASGNGCALELFQFIDPPAEAPAENFTYWVGGFFHICVVDPDVAGLAKRIEATGGRIRASRIWEEFERERAGADEPYLSVYCEDPFGNIIELFSHSHETVFANSSYFTPPPEATRHE
jgi:catechol 2,3-dioxygenase-like lactoylglutathione lyase family enzyme